MTATDTTPAAPHSSPHSSLLGDLGSTSSAGLQSPLCSTSRATLRSTYSRNSSRQCTTTDTNDSASRKTTWPTSSSATIGTATDGRCPTLASNSEASPLNSHTPPASKRKA